ncbi:hypothetical protein [Deinococcus sp.]|uniref:hypothetical protein n=1 Tax=Deinococcus sp. TaxID=47478 RepID=UPI003C7C2D38
MTCNASFPVARAVRVVLIVSTLLLILAALALAALAFGSLAGLNTASPPLLSALSAAEGLFSARLGVGLDAFWRALTWAGLCCLCVWFAAYLKPR